MMTAVEGKQPSARLITPVFLLVTVATFLYFVSIGALIPTLPLYVEGPLRGSGIAVGLAVGSFSLSAVLIRPWVGRLTDRRGRRLSMLIGSGLVGISVFGYLLADSFVTLLPWRLVTGAGEAFFYVGAASVINDLAPDSRRGEALSFFSLALYSGLAVGPVAGEWMLDVTSFSGVWALAALSAFAATALGVAVPETRPENVRTAIGGRIVHPAGLLPGTLLAASVVGLGGFNTFVPLYAQDMGMSGSRLVFVAFSVVVLTVRLFGARIPDRFGTRRTARASLSASGAGLAVIAATGTPAGLYVGASIFAVGQALCFPALMSLAIGSAPASERGAVVGTFTAFFDLAFGLGALSLGFVAEQHGYDGAFYAGALAAFLGVALMVGYARRDAARSRPTGVEEQQEPLGS